MKRLLSILTASLVLCLTLCGASVSQPTIPQTVRQQRTFHLPEVPTILNTPEARATFVCEHYWDHFDFADTAYIHLPDITEQAIVNFMDLMPRVAPDLAARSLAILYQKAAPHSRMLWHFWETMSRYWNDPHSPMRNEDMFILMCRQVEAVEAVEVVLRQQAAFRRRLAEKNRVGEAATDFTYTLASGKAGRLSEIPAPYTLLVFHNPDCHTCAEVKRSMTASVRLSELVRTGRLAVLTLYPDEDVALWRSHLQEMPTEWLNAYDKGLRLTREDRYDLSSIPSLYLLDKDKKVLLKDVSWEEVREYLQQIP